MSEIIAAGLAVQARNTGRVLVLQRAYDKRDPAGGTWEFPGGHLETGELPLDAAKREWQEETGIYLPRGSLQSEWTYGIYKGYVWSIASESDIEINLKGRRRFPNPDGDEVETVAWWYPEQLKGNPAVRRELKQSMHLVQRALDRDYQLERKYETRLEALRERRQPKTASILQISQQVRQQLQQQQAAADQPERKQTVQKPATPKPMQLPNFIGRGSKPKVALSSNFAGLNMQDILSSRVQGGRSALRDRVLSRFTGINGTRTR